MTSRDFAFWLQGYFEVSEPKEIGPTETEQIKKHLNLVFKHEIDPSYSDDPEHQKMLNDIHNPPKPKPNNFRDKDGTLLRC